MYRIHQIKLGLHEEMERIPEKIKRKLHLPRLSIDQWKVVRESVDARDKENIKRVYSVDFSCEATLDVEGVKDLQIAKDDTYEIPSSADFKRRRPIIVGAGPCGLLAAWVLAKAKVAPLILERGKPVPERTRDVEAFWKTGKLDPESNVQFGEGGAGTFSDGKLTTGTKDPRIAQVLRLLAKAGGGEELLYKQRPHIGTDRLKTVVPNLRREIEKAGGEFCFSTRLSGLKIKETEEGRCITGVEVIRAEGDEKWPEEIATDDLILATGHSARDIFSMLAERKVPMEQKPFSMGVRIQHPQCIIDMAQYGDPALANILGPAEYKLVHHGSQGRNVYTFCMCPGGEIVCAASAPGQVVTNGMSNARRDGEWANSGLLAEVKTSDIPGDHPLDAVRYQQHYEELAFQAGGGHYKLPQTTWGSFDGSQVAACLPGDVVSAIIEAMPHLGRKLRGFDDPEAIMVGVETRSSSPVRILRDPRSRMSDLCGLFPAGEGAGYAGGIMSAAVDGMRVAEAVLAREHLAREGEDDTMKTETKGAKEELP